MQRVFLTCWSTLVCAALAQAQTPDCWSNSTPPPAPVKRSWNPLAAWRASWPVYPTCGANKTFADFGCNGWKSDCRFIFGSCWEFFREPCPVQQGPPWHRHVEGLGPMKGYGSEKRPCNDW